MCRLVAYFGAELHLEDILIKPQNSLLQQSIHANEAKVAVNGDGFGIAWYGHFKEPGLFRHSTPAWSDGNLLNIARHIRSCHFLAHVRAANVGESTITNCHPFVYERWSFMHNGQIEHFDKIRRRLEARLCNELYLARRGTTDSELIFLLMLEFGLAENPLNAITQAIKIISREAHESNIKLTCIISNGERLFALRYAPMRCAPTLYMHKSPDSQNILLASEPLQNDNTNWHSVQTDVILSFSKTKDGSVVTESRSLLCDV